MQDIVHPRFLRPVFFPRQLKAIGVLTSNKEGKVICEIAGRVLGGMQFGVLVEVLFCELDGRALGGVQFAVLVEVPLCEIDGRVLGGMQFGVWWRCRFARLTAKC